MKRVLILSFGEIGTWGGFRRLRDFLGFGSGWTLDLGRFHMSSTPREALVQSWIALSEKQNPWPKSRNNNDYWNMDMYGDNTRDATLVLQEISTGQVKLLELNNPPKEKDQMISRVTEKYPGYVILTIL